MLPEELRKKVKQIELTTRRVIDDVMSGGYRSHFKGQGMQFSEHRVYVAGDDVRHIDWKVSARTKEPLIKKYEEERELNVLFVVDISGSEKFGSLYRTKSEVAAEIAALIASAAEVSGDKTGLLMFSGEIEKCISPKRGRTHLLRMIRDILNVHPKTEGTRLREALERAQKLMKHRGIVFVISDFIADDYETALLRLSRKNEVVAIRVSDEYEWNLPDIGSISVIDPESGAEGLVRTSSYGFKRLLEEERKKFESRFEQACLRARADELKIETREDHVEAVVGYFKSRRRLGRR